MRSSLSGHPGLVSLRYMPEHDMRVRLLDARMPSIEVDVDMINLATGGGEIVEALVLVRKVFDGQHVDRADEPSVPVISEEWTGRQCLGINIKLPESRQEIGQRHKVAHLLVGTCWWRLLNLVGGDGRHGKCSGESDGGKAGIMRSSMGELMTRVTQRIGWNANPEGSTVLQIMHSDHTGPGRRS